MRMWGVSKYELETIAKRLGFKLENVREGGVRERWVAFTLRMAAPLPSRSERNRYEKGQLSYEADQKYQAAMKYRGKSIYPHERWKNSAVCWHGHKAFIEEVLKIKSDLRFESKLWKFRGRAEFMEKVEATGFVNVGSQAYPVQAREACDCGY